MKWIDSQTLFRITVEHHESPRSGGRPYYPMTPTGIGVIHTTENSSVAGALSTLATNFDASHFVVGQGRIVQLRPLGVQAAALHSPQNQYAEMQIECIGFSQQHLYLFDDPTLKPLAALLAWATENTDIPLERPSPDWKEDMSDVKPYPSSNNSRRTSGIWPNKKGWYGHLEVSSQQPSNHWDPGALKYTELFTQVRNLIAFP